MMSAIRKFTRITLSMIVLFLSFISVIETQRSGISGTGEILNGVPIYKINDNLLWHLASALIIILGMNILKILLDKGKRADIFVSKYLKLFQIFIAILSGIISLFILAGGIRTPVNDQIQVYGAAQLFNEGNYLNLSKGGYVNMYPQQLGYILYMQVILMIAGSLGFQAVQITNCIFIIGVVYAGCCLLNDLTEQAIPRILGSCFFLFLLPLQLMCSWVYGDIPFYFFMFLCLHNYILLHRTEKRRYFVAVIITASLCLLFRKHTLILLIAVAAVSVLLVIEKRKYIYLLTGVLSLVIPFGITSCIETYYAAVSGYEVDGGIPSIAWITMGTIEDGSKPGWFNNYSVPIYYATNCSRKLTSEIALERLETQLAYFAENPVYALSFYKRKLCTQWNDPYFNTEYMISVDAEQSPKGLSLILQENEESILFLLSCQQSIIYIGMLAYLIIASKKDEITDMLLHILILGGFAFSILWEANSRYVFSWYLIMLPMAAAGWYRLFCKLRG